MNVAYPQKEILEATIEIAETLSSKIDQREPNKPNHSILNKSNLLLNFKKMKGVILQAQTMKSSFGLISKEEFPEYGKSLISIYPRHFQQFLKNL